MIAIVVLSRALDPEPYRHVPAVARLIEQDAVDRVRAGDVTAGPELGRRNEEDRDVAVPVDIERRVDLIETLQVEDDWRDRTLCRRETRWFGTKKRYPARGPLQTADSE